MSDASPEEHTALFAGELKTIAEQVIKANRDGFDKNRRDLFIVQNRLYFQLESLSWLQRNLKINGQLPPLRGWAASPDVLLMLHN